MARHVLALVTDAFGGCGGIARYNKDLLSALAASAGVETITALPRIAPEDPGQLPAKVRQLRPILHPLAYSIAALREAVRVPKDLVIFCGHILMAPLGAALSLRTGAPMWLQVHGLEAWPQPRRRVRWAAERASLITSVSRFTRAQMIANWWSGDPVRIRILPNTVCGAFQPGPKPPDLVSRYGLSGKKVLLTVSRVSVADRYKGHERILAALPRIRAMHPEAVYLIVGDGDDLPRLRHIADELGLRDDVHFTGRVPDSALPDHFRAADVFIMPSMEEGFGIVFLEAAASGLHVIGGRLDGSWDALREGVIGDAIDPNRQEEIVMAVCQALDAPRPPD